MQVHSHNVAIATILTMSPSRLQVHSHNVAITTILTMSPSRPPREAQRGPERPKQARKSPNRLGEARRRGPEEKPREAQRGPRVYEMKKHFDAVFTNFQIRKFVGGKNHFDWNGFGLCFYYLTVMLPDSNI